MPLRNITRRRFTFVATLLGCLATIRVSARAGSRPRILLRSSWQTVNIGDVGHTPGVLRLLEEHLPEAEIRLWPSNIGDGVKEMLLARFPGLRLVLDASDRRAAFHECDFLLHGSGPYLVADKDVRRWHRETGKPFGVFGITLMKIDDELRDLLSLARFVFLRDSRSLTRAKERGVACEILDFGPDGAFAVDVRNDLRARSFLDLHGLSPGRFLCCIPRLRYTPYWTIHPDRPKDPQKEAINLAMMDRDHEPLREAIAAIVRTTDVKVLVCPEDRTQMLVGRQAILDRLPEDVRRRVVWRKDFWLTDETVSTYIMSAGVFGLEMHSPIMAVGNGIPAVVGRFAEQSTKGFMWQDIGLGEWLFDLDDPKSMAGYVPAVLELARNPQAARLRAEEARKFVSERHRFMVATLRQEVSK